MRRLLLILFLLVAAPLALAQQSEDEERSGFVAFVENQLSTPGRQIRLIGFAGTLSSNVSVQKITIADKQGVWLEIDDARLVWTRSALLRGRLEIDELTAARIAIARTPLPDESLPAPEAGRFRIPELPVAVVLDRLSVPSIRFGEPVFGMEAEVSTEGSVILDGGSLDLALKMARLDGPGGQFDIIANYAADATDLKLDVRLSEPQNGIIANLLQIPGRPPVNLEMAGEAPLEQFDLAMALDIAGRRVLEGAVDLSPAADGLAVDVDLSGPLGSIMQPQERRFFGEQSKLVASIDVPDAGGLRIRRFDLSSGVVDASGVAEVLADGFLSKLEVTAALVRRGTDPVALPFGETPAEVDNARFTVSYGNGRDWRAELNILNYAASDLGLQSGILRATGTLDGLDEPAARAITFRANGGLTGLEPKDEAVAQALGEAIGLSFNGTWKSGEAIKLQSFAINGREADFIASGEIASGTFDGTMDAAADDLSSFSLLAGRDLTGKAAVKTSGTLTPLTGAFDLTLKGLAENLTVGIAQTDPLLRGETRLAGRIARGENGLVFDKFALTNAAAEIAVNGRLASTAADIAATAKLADLALVTEDATGALALDARITGAAQPFKVGAQAAVESGTLLGRPLRGARLAFDGTVAGTTLDGKVSGSGSYAGDDIRIAAAVNRNNERLALNDLDARVGPTRIGGGIEVGANRLLSGDLRIDSTDIASAAALALVEASGGLKGDLKLTPTAAGKQSAVAAFAVRDLTYAGNRAGSAELKAAVDDLFGTPSVDAIVKASSVRAGGVTIETLDASALTKGTTTDFDARADISGGTRLNARGRLDQRQNGFRAELAALSLDSPIASAALAAPAIIERSGATTRLSGVRFNVGGGAVSADGSVGDTLDMNVRVEGLPLAIANAIRPDLRAAGTVSGTARIGGRPTEPDATFQLTGSGVSFARLDSLGLDPLAVSVTGRGSRAGLRLEAGKFSNAQGLDVSANGTIPFSGSGLSVIADGTAPLTLAAPALAARGTRLDGSVRFNTSFTGSLAAPQARGLISIDGASVSDPLSNIAMRDVTLVAGLQGERIEISRFSAAFARGGNVAASGTIGTAGDLPADISVTLTGVTYTDAQIFRATLGGSLRLSGSLARDPLLSGEVNVEKADITVPESFAAASDVLDVEHVRPDAAARETLARVERVSPKATPTARPSVIQLDVTVNAPSRIFVRGRGIDAELGGTVRLAGPVTRIEPVGAFRLLRGRLSILGKRLNFQEGSITFTGDLDPQINLVASTSAQDADAFITVTGPASNPDIVFSSQPELPQDEVLARIVFDRSIAELSPVQIARLAAVAAELTGGKAPSLLGSLREGSGLDDLDVVADDDGNAAVRAGRYVTDRVYLGVQAGKTSEATINLDITDSLKARGSVDTKGDSSIGIFFEKDY